MGHECFQGYISEAFQPISTQILRISYVVELHHGEHQKKYSTNAKGGVFTIRVKIYINFPRDNHHQWIIINLKSKSKKSW